MCDKENPFSCSAREMFQNNQNVQQLESPIGEVLISQWNKRVATSVAKDSATEGIKLICCVGFKVLQPVFFQ